MSAQSVLGLDFFHLPGYSTHVSSRNYLRQAGSARDSVRAGTACLLIGDTQESEVVLPDSTLQTRFVGVVAFPISGQFDLSEESIRKASGSAGKRMSRNQLIAAFIKSLGFKQYQLVNYLAGFSGLEVPVWVEGRVEAGNLVYYRQDPHPTLGSNLLGVFSDPNYVSEGTVVANGAKWAESRANGGIARIYFS